MIQFNRLSVTQQAILRIIDEREGASALYLSERLNIAQPSIRRTIGELRTAGYDIPFGVERSCTGQKLYSWVKSPVDAQPVVAEEVTPASV